VKKLLYNLQFLGSAAPKDGNPAVLAVVAKASSGVGAGLNAALGATSEATFESTVTMGADGATFDESGSISFGRGNSVRFTTVDQGHVAPSPEPGVTAGAVIWKIDGGDGDFAGASGYITSNFWFDMEGRVTDNQLGAIFVP